MELASKITVIPAYAGILVAWCYVKPNP